MKINDPDFGVRQAIKESAIASGLGSPHSVGNTILRTFLSQFRRHGYEIVKVEVCFYTKKPKTECGCPRCA